MTRVSSMLNANRVAVAARSIGPMFLALVALFAVASQPARADQKPADVQQAIDLTQQTANKVISQIKANQDQVKDNPEALLKIVDQVLLPHVDSERMSRLVLGRYWRRASAKQRQEFTVQFRRLLVRTYAGPLSQLGNQTVKVTGTKPGPDKDEIVVESVVSGGDMGSVPVDYRMSREDGTWKAYDLIIDGISLVNNYRGSFGQEIQSKGIDGLINTLRSRNND